jgi:hypothetical protein
LKDETVRSKDTHPSSLIPHPSSAKPLVPWNQRRLPLWHYVHHVVVEIFFEVCCWTVGEFFLFWLSFGLLKSKVQKMNQTPRRLRLVACFGLVLILLFTFFVGRCAFGEDSPATVPLKTAWMETSGPGKVQGVVIAAPHEPYDGGVGEIAKRIGADLGIGWVVAHDYRSVKRKTYVNVNRPTENLYDGDEREGNETETPLARAVYEEYQRKVLQAAGLSQGPLKLHIEIHGHARRAKIGGESQIVQVIEMANTGFTAEELSVLKAAWEKAADTMKSGSLVPLIVEHLDPCYEYQGEQIKFHWNAGPAKRTGVFRPECAQRSLHFELPPLARRRAGKEAFITAAEALIRAALARI